MRFFEKQCVGRSNISRGQKLSKVSDLDFSGNTRGGICVTVFKSLNKSF